MNRLAGCASWHRASDSDEHLVALTRIETDGRQSGSVQLGLSLGKHVQVASAGCSGRRHRGATLSLGCHSVSSMSSRSPHTVPPSAHPGWIRAARSTGSRIQAFNQYVRLRPQQCSGISQNRLLGPSPDQIRGLGVFVLVRVPGIARRLLIPEVESERDAGLQFVDVLVRRRQFAPRKAGDELPVLIDDEA